jgi:hypothetical protein
VQGLDSPSLRELAGLLVREAPYEARRLADRALEELGLVAAEQSAADRAVAQSWARDLLDDRTGPFVAARAIWKCFANSDAQLPDLAADFLALEDEWEGGWGRVESEIAVEMRRAASRLLRVWGDPLDPGQRFHSAVRREILRRFDHWADIYASGAPWEVSATEGQFVTDRPEDVFPRYRVLEDLLIEVERIDPNRISPQDLRREISACSTTKSVTALRSYAAADDELRSLAKWIDSMDPVPAPAQFLPYRRTLDEREVSLLRNELNDRWTNGDECWYPMTSKAVPDDVVILDSRLWFDESAVNAVREALLDEGVTVLRCLNELRPSNEVATEFFDPAYASDGEIHAMPVAGWFVIYTSHEGTTAFSPGPHVDRLRAAVPNFDRWIWQGWQ